MKKALLILLSLCAVLVGQAAQDNRQSVAVYVTGIVPKGEAQGADKALSGELGKAIGRTPKYVVVNRSNAVLKTLAQELTYAQSGAVKDAETQRKKIGQQDSVQYLCVLEISVLGRGYYVEAKLIHVESAREVNSATAASRLDDANEIMAVAKRIALELTGVDVGAAPAVQPVQPPVQEVKPAPQVQQAAPVQPPQPPPVQEARPVQPPPPPPPPVQQAKPAPQAQQAAPVRSQPQTPTPTKTTFTDSRDEKVYTKVKIGGKTWMAENLNYAASGSKCYDNNARNCYKYGRLYDWDAAMKACPAGWHLATDAEWTALVDYAGGRSTAGTKLKSSTGWNSKSGVPAGTDNYGFSALPGGNGRSDGSFINAGYYGFWWSATENGANSARYRYINYDDEYVYWNHDSKAYLFSVRCVQDGP
jgi:uncharacterized protein (TIGR02145 family)